jgi:hypothetical protein
MKFEASSMRSWLIGLSALLLVALPASARTDEMFTLTPQSQAVLGESGDTFGIEPPAAHHVVVLLNPDGEDCTLRFPVKQGEGFRVFVRAGLDQRLACDVSLAATGKGATATFSTHCVAAEPRAEPRCPSPN